MWLLFAYPFPNLAVVGGVALIALAVALRPRLGRLGRARLLGDQRAGRPVVDREIVLDEGVQAALGDQAQVDRRGAEPAHVGVVGQHRSEFAHLPTPPVPGPDQWVVEIWIDPDWYAAQQPEDPMPSAGLPGLVVLRERSVLVGRPSVSRGIHPQVDCGADTGVSRRHCQLSTDGQRWWVEDLQSSNGTYVSPAGEPLPTDPIPAGQRRELADGDRVYLGAWTRLVVRKALPGEA